MISFIHKCIPEPLEIIPGLCHCVVVENPNLLYRFMNDVLMGDEDSLSLIKDDMPLDWEKKTLVITDLFALDPNGKKIINAIYKGVGKRLLSPERREKLEAVKQAVNDLMEDIACDFNEGTTYDSDLSIEKVMGLADFRFDYQRHSFYENLIAYIKACQEISDPAIIITYNAFDLIDEQDFETFAHEISMLGVGLIDFSGQKIRSGLNNIALHIIDSDGCYF